MARRKKKIHDLVFDDSIPTGLDTQLSPVIPNNKTARLCCFGWSCPLDGSTVAVQWGVPGNWRTIRGGYGNMNLNLEKEFNGNGTRRFRIVRRNAGSGTQVIMAWMHVILINDFQ